ncbi:MAG: hypothetical protein HY735_00960 [Verrucomicrobia bacterium]|nr:hypothetical protein [Verrucomicrobiota bacterium]
MKPILTAQNMRRLFPGEWLLIRDPKLDQDLNLIAGRVIAHSANRDDVYRRLLKASGKSLSIEYTGELPTDHAVAL